ncbi:MAG: hypothetical protein KatS3mg111_4095 [Pirellulaceae bacterium]|nr:MAG: hypothetical protein KatS3mg111_4095 [Pirellulaceae bacterium]
MSCPSLPHRKTMGRGAPFGADQPPIPAVASVPVPVPRKRELESDSAATQRPRHLTWAADVHNAVWVLLAGLALLTTAQPAPDVGAVPPFHVFPRCYSMQTVDVSIQSDEGWVDLGGHRKKYVYRWWATEQRRRSAVIIVHGLGEHGGRYRRLASMFAAAGYQVVAFDQQGHGRSPEPRGCIASYTSLLDDVEAIVRWTEKQAASRIALFGHSMGGNLVLNYVLRSRPGVASLIASSPMLRAVRQPSRPIELVLRLLRFIVPNLCLQSRVTPQRLMDDPVEIEEFQRDPLFHTRLSLRLAAALVDSGRWALHHAHLLRTPALLTHGTADRITSCEASIQFAARAGAYCQLELLPGVLHDPFRCSVRPRVVQRYIDFLQSSIPDEPNDDH